MTLYRWMRLDSRLTTSCRENFLGKVWLLYWCCWAFSEPRNEEDLLETDFLWWVVVMFVSCWWHETWTLTTPWSDLVSWPHDKLLTFYFRLYTTKQEQRKISSWVSVLCQVLNNMNYPFEKDFQKTFESLTDCMNCLSIIWIFPWVCLILVTRRWLTPDIILICWLPLNSVATWWLNNNIQYFMIMINYSLSVTSSCMSESLHSLWLFISLHSDTFLMKLNEWQFRTDR